MERHRHVHVDDGSRPQHDGHTSVESADDDIGVSVAVHVEAAGERVAERRQGAGRREVGRDDALGVVGYYAVLGASEDVDGAGAFVWRADREICM